MTTESPSPSVPNKSDLRLEIGRKIEERRKSRGLSLEKVSLSIKIKPSFLKSMETGDWKDLPGEVYARGFIGRYATFLGLNPQEILAPYLEFQSSEEKKPSQPQRPDRPMSFPTNGFIWATLGVVLVGGLIKLMVNQKSAVEAPVPVVVQAEVKEPVAVPSVIPAVSIKKLVPHSLDVFSPFPLWLSVKSETRSFEGFLPQSSTWSWKGEGNFSIRLGHTQQVALMFDGQQITLSENQKKVSLPLEN